MKTLRYKFFVHVRHPSYRLVTRADVPFPSGTSEDEWRLTRSREAGDVNAEVRGAVDQNGYSLFRIGLRSPKFHHNATRRAQFQPARRNLPPIHTFTPRLIFWRM